MLMIKSLKNIILIIKMKLDRNFLITISLGIKESNNNNNNTEIKKEEECLYQQK